jgi:hypothetical protein
MLRIIVVFAAGLVVGVSVAELASSSQKAATTTRVMQLRLYTIDKGRLDDFAAAWRNGVYPLRLKMEYRIPFAAKIPATNQFVWLLAYDGPESWDKKEAAYYGSAERKAISPDPAQWIARPEQLLVQSVLD